MNSPKERFLLKKDFSQSSNPFILSIPKIQKQGRVQRVGTSKLSRTLLI